MIIRMIIRMIMKWALAPVEATINSTTFTGTKARLKCFNIVVRPAFLSHWFVANISWTSFLGQKICKIYKTCTTKKSSNCFRVSPAFVFVASIANFWSCLLCGRILTILKSLVGQKKKIMTDLFDYDSHLYSKQLNNEPFCKLAKLATMKSIFLASFALSLALASQFRHQVFGMRELGNGLLPKPSFSESDVNIPKFNFSTEFIVAAARKPQFYFLQLNFSKSKTLCEVLVLFSQILHQRISPAKIWRNPFFQFWKSILDIYSPPAWYNRRGITLRIKSIWRINSLDEINPSTV